MTRTTSDKISEFVANLSMSAKSLVKIALQSRHCGVAAERENADRKLIIMGNGPSLATAIAESPASLSTNPLLAVNFAANAPEFTRLRPEYYVMADPHFFTDGVDPNVDRLYSNLNAVDWQMTLFIPAKAAVPARLDNPNIKISRFNPVGVEGFSWLTDRAYSSGRGMPRPRNVLIPAIMIGIRLGFNEIYIAGADHTWTKTLSVNERNEVVSIQPHFYKDNDEEQQRVRTTYLNYPLHKIMESFTIAFRAYHQIEAFARRKGIAIYNSTPGSFIDAFRRRPLP